MALNFEWDAVKARVNLQKHKVSFEEAQTIFTDPFLLIYADDAHSGQEERFIGIGRSQQARILLAVHTDRSGVIRLISCRKATSAERKFYESQ